MTAHVCVCRICKREIRLVVIGESRWFGWGHTEIRRGGDKHPARPPRGWTEAELRAVWGDR